MTESEWLLSTDPAAMLRLYTSDEMPWPRGAPAPIVSDRKLRLFACACSRLWGEASREDLDRWESSGPVHAPDHGRWARDWARSSRCRPATAAALLRCLVGNPWRLVRLPRRQPRCRQCGCETLYGHAEGVSQVFFCKSCHHRQPWGEDWQGASAPWLTPAALAIARSIHAERRWGDLPILADALEEAGCEDAGLLGHLRGPGPHARGCWALDLVLGKE